MEPRPPITLEDIQQGPRSVELSESEDVECSALVDTYEPETVVDVTLVN